MSATVTNGKPRRQLSDQLDRLEEQLQRHDQVLDALSEGLNGAVADAAHEGTRAAVKDAVIELLVDPDLRAALHRASAPPAAARLSRCARLRERVRQAAQTASDLAGRARAAATTAAAALAARAAAARVTGLARAAWRLRRVVLAGLGVGVVVAGAAYATTHGVAAGLSGFGAAVATVAVRAGLWVRTAARRLAPA